MILPDRDAPLLTRELIYTGITRAKRSVELLGTAELFQSAVKRRIVRRSGLRERLWPELPGTASKDKETKKSDKRPCQLQFPW
jgi:ATP-dependent exoDNAse (exonuclease V) alpha subunit